MVCSIGSFTWDLIEEPDYQLVFKNHLMPNPFGLKVLAPFPGARWCTLATVSWCCYFFKRLNFQAVFQFNGCEHLESPLPLMGYVCLGI